MNRHASASHGSPSRRIVMLLALTAAMTSVATVAGDGDKLVIVGERHPDVLFAEVIR